MRLNVVYFTPICLSCSFFIIASFAAFGVPFFFFPPYLLRCVRFSSECDYLCIRSVHITLLTQNVFCHVILLWAGAHGSSSIRFYVRIHVSVQLDAVGESTSESEARCFLEKKERKQAEREKKLHRHRPNEHCFFV